MSEEQKWIIEIDSVYKNYDHFAVLKGIDLKIKQGEWISFIGASGCGKTTLLNLIAGFDTINSGDIKIFNESIKNKLEKEKAKILENHIGFIFQAYHLLNELTVIENICIPYLNSNYNWKEAKKKAASLLELVEMRDKENCYPLSLSGGEKQRTAIARALINDPEIILADEPTGNLDEQNTLKIKNLLKDIQKKSNKTIILVTHNSIMAEESDRKFRLKYGVLKQYE